jgi:hypothetical protein
MTTTRPPRPEVRCTVRWVLLLSIFVYVGWGIWPLAEWLTFELNRRDFCGDLHNAGIAFSVECLLAALFQGLTLIVVSKNRPRDLLPGNAYFCSGIVLPLAALIIFFLAALASTIWVTTYIESESGQLCKHESAMFFEGAKLFARVTLGMLAGEFLVITWVCNLLLCRSHQAHVWTSVVDVDAPSGVEINGAGNSGVQVSP